MGTGGAVSQRFLQRELEIVQVERLFQHRPIRMQFRNRRIGVARNEDEWSAARDERIGYRRNRPAIEIDVEDGNVEISIAGSLQCFFDLRCLGRDGVAELPHHIDEQHADHQLIFHDEDTLCIGGGLRTGC